MVPLTPSLYVPGTICDTNKVLLDVGTGYFVEKSLAKSKDFVDRKNKMVTANADQIQGIAQQKQKNLETIVMIMRQRMAMMQQQREDAKAGT